MCKSLYSVHSSTSMCVQSEMQLLIYKMWKCEFIALVNISNK